MYSEEVEKAVAEAEQLVRMQIAKKMKEDRFTPQMIKKYTGIRLEEEVKETDEYDLAARQVAADMLLRGLPADTVQVATRLPHRVILELKNQLPF